MISKLFKFLLNYYASLRGIEAQRTASLKAASNTQTKRNPLPHCTTTTTSVVPLLSVYSGMLWISPSFDAVCLQNDDQSDQSNAGIVLWICMFLAFHLEEAFVDR